MAQEAAFPYLARHRQDLYHCATCNYCVSATWPERGIDGVCATLRSHSPVASYSGKGYLVTARALLEGEPLDLVSVAERAYACTTCGNCEAACPIGMPPTAVLKALRTELHERGHAPAVALAVRDHVLTRQNPWGAPAAHDSDWSLGLAPHPQPDLWLLPGCAAAHRHPAEVRAAAQLLSVIGFDVGWPRHVTCCGAPLTALGFSDDAAMQHAALTASLPQQLTLALLGGECLSRRGADGRPAQPVLQLLHAALHDGRLAVAARGDAPPPAVVAVQDSCHLSKPHHGLTDLDVPRLLREVLAALGCQVAQAAAASRYAICCGAAGGMAQLHPASARHMAVEIHTAADRFGAEALITASPLCAGHLAGSGGQLPVYGICEFIAAHYAVAGPNV